MHIIGRTREQDQLNRLVHSGRPEFLVIYGRRRVGKTFLIKNYFNERFSFYATGVTDVNNRSRLKSFRDALRLYGDTDKAIPADWFEAFSRMRLLLESDSVIRDPASGRRVIFLDELPWMDSPRSDFRGALDHFWNSYASSKPDIMLIVCGSATSWIINHILDNTGGLYNRITAQMHLMPFTLRECEEFYSANDLPMNRQAALESYMIFGGIPYYLNLLDPRLSLAQNVEELIFRPAGHLYNEFDHLFRSLFRNPEKHVAVIMRLSEHIGGMLRTELAAFPDIRDGEQLTKVLAELEQCGFIRKYRNFITKKHGCYYQLTDPFTLFHIRFRIREGISSWIPYTRAPGHNAWSGISFELVCLLHTDQIRRSLGIDGIECNIFAWRSKASVPGAQIDLLIDRSDNVINICEIKYSSKEYIIDAAYADALENKVSVFVSETGTKKAPLITLITASGLKQNKHFHIVQRVLTAEDLLVF